MFRTDLLSTIRNLNTVYTANGICHTSYVDCLLARSGCSILTSLAERIPIAIDSNQSSLNLYTGRPPTCVMIPPDAVEYKFDLLMIT